MGTGFSPNSNSSQMVVVMILVAIYLAMMLPSHGRGKASERRFFGSASASLPHLNPPDIGVPVREGFAGEGWIEAGPQARADVRDSW